MSQSLRLMFTATIMGPSRGPVIPWYVFVTLNLNINPIKLNYHNRYELIGADSGKSSVAAANGNWKLKTQSDGYYMCIEYPYSCSEHKTQKVVTKKSGRR